MSSPHFITPAQLQAAVQQLLKVAHLGKQKAQTKLDRNVLDPFSAAFEMAGFGMDAARWRENEAIRQAQKTLTNHVGSFHQHILGCVAGWEDLGAGKGKQSTVDLACPSRKLIAEIKNKHNTVKASDQVHTYDALYKCIQEKGQIYHGYTAYFVEIIPKKPERYDVPFTPPDNKTGLARAENGHIRKIDGASFYTLVTGEQYALRDLYRAVLELLNTQFTISDKAVAMQLFEAAYGAG